MLVGILNLTPDSFSDGGSYARLDAALRQAERMLEEGAEMIDIGGESTRPGAARVATHEQIQRILPALRAIKKNFCCFVSVDTSCPQVMQAALAESVDMINDVRGFRRLEDWKFLAESEVALCIMHMQGEPQDMQINPSYENLLEEVKDYLAKRLEYVNQQGIPSHRVCLDPGFGFGKTTAHNLALLQNLQIFGSLPAPLYVGLSRKSLFQDVCNRSKEQRDTATAISSFYAACQGAKFIRVHNVAASKDAIQLAKYLG